MVFGFLKKQDSIYEMKEEKGEGIEKQGLTMRPKKDIYENLLILTEKGSVDFALDMAGASDKYMSEVLAYIVKYLDSVRRAETEYITNHIWEFVTAIKSHLDEEKSMPLQTKQEKVLQALREEYPIEARLSEKGVDEYGKAVKKSEHTSKSCCH